MANEILKRDADREPVSGGVTDNAALEVRMLRVDPTTNRLKVDVNVTQYAEDAAHASGDSGIMALAVRNDALAALAGSDGDYTPFQVNADGAQYVEVSSALPIGANAIGKLAANSGVDIGDVDVTSIAAGMNVIGKVRMVTASGDEVTEDTDNSVNVTLVADDVGIGGGTQYAVDVALGATPTGTLAVAIRDDVLSALTPVEGDAIGLRVDANGALWTRDDVLEAAISGSEMQVDVVAALPTGANAIGKLAANSGVDIGDVDVNSVVPGVGATNLGKAIDSAGGATDTGVAILAIRDDTLTTVTPAEGDYAPLRVGEYGDLWVSLATKLDKGNDEVLVWANTAKDGTGTDYVPLVDAAGHLQVDVLSAVVAGNVAHDAVDSGNPIKIGGKAQTHLAAPDEVADNDRVNALFDRVGRLGVYQGYVLKSAPINCASSGNNTIVAAVATKRIRVLAVAIVSDGTTDVRWESGAGGTALTGQVPLQTREGYTISNPWGLFETAAVNTLLNLELTAAVNVHGWVTYIEVDD